MTSDDIALGLRLKEQAGWNQTPADWRRFLELSPDGCFVAEFDGRSVGTTTTCLLGGVGWIAMVLVDASARNRGIGGRLVQHGVAHLLGNGARTVRLDATALGRPVYERLGFVPDYELSRFEGVAAGAAGVDPSVVPVESADLNALGRLDKAVTGTMRQRLLERLFFETPERCARIARDGGAMGYAMWREGSRAAAIGPAVSLNSDDGVVLLDWVLLQCRGRSIFVDIPAGNVAAVEWAQSRGLSVQRQFLRMHLGERVCDCPEKIWASSGPEKG